MLLRLFQAHSERRGTRYTAQKWGKFAVAPAIIGMAVVCVVMARRIRRRRVNVAIKQAQRLQERDLPPTIVEASIAPVTPHVPFAAGPAVLESITPPVKSIETDPVSAEIPADSSVSTANVLPLTDSGSGTSASVPTPAMEAWQPPVVLTHGQPEAASTVPDGAPVSNRVKPRRLLVPAIIAVSSVAIVYAAVAAMRPAHVTNSNSKVALASHEMVKPAVEPNLPAVEPATKPASGSSAPAMVQTPEPPSPAEGGESSLVSPPGENNPGHQRKHKLRSRHRRTPLEKTGSLLRKVL